MEPSETLASDVAAASLSLSLRGAPFLGRRQRPREQTILSTSFAKMFQSTETRRATEGNYPEIGGALMDAKGETGERETPRRNICWSLFPKSWAVEGKT